MTELLSPAGNLEAGIAAFRYGADAVYLGLQSFSARADADNFSFEDLSTLLGIAHNNPQGPRKVYVAINTLLRERELPDLIDTLARLRDLGPDALIIQDWAVYDLVRTHFPELTLHASTQLAVHNVQGARQAAELGFSRVITARELTMTEISDIAAIPGLEVEVFIHGALCYSYSGLCQLSATLKGASGNRGECAYICRKKCGVSRCSGACEEANVMSMKDLAAPDMIQSLKKAGVASLKIEGRKKTPLYVAAVTNYYRHILDGSFEAGEQQRSEADIKTIFSRPWTPFHLKNRKQAAVTDTRCVGHRGVEIGTVTEVVKGSPDRLRFTVKGQPLEKHDGLQVELPTRDKPYGFPVNDIRLFAQRNVESWKSVFVAPVDATIEVGLPDDHPDLPVGAKIACPSSQKVKQAYDWEAARPAQVKERAAVNFVLTVHPHALSIDSTLANAPAGIPPVHTAMALDETLSPAKNLERLESSITSSLSRLGDTDFALANLHIDNPQQLFIPTSILNELRRCAAEDLQEARDLRFQSVTRDVQERISAWKPSEAAGVSKATWTIKVDKPYFLNLFTQADFADVEDVIFSLERTAPDDLDEALAEILRLVGTRNKIRLSLPTIFRPNTPGAITLPDIARLFHQGWRRWEATNIDARQLLREAGADTRNLHLTADWQLYATNRAAAKALLEQGYAKVTLSPADIWQNWSDLLGVLGDTAQVIVYQDTPLAISDVCANASLKGFCPGKAACDFKTMTLTTRDDDRLTAVNNHCQTVIIHGQPFNLAGNIGKLKRLGARHLRADFIWKDYAPTTVKTIWQNLLQDKNAAEDAPWTANLLTSC